MVHVKGVILAGGTGTRLRPCTRVTNKHLLPVYDKPMIFYPLHTLIASGIQDILIVSGREHAGDFIELLGSGEEFGVRLSYAVQEDSKATGKPGGIAAALRVAKDFVVPDSVAVILGDGVFQDIFPVDVAGFLGGARIFLKRVPDAERFGVAVIRNGRIRKLVEKPKKFISPYAITGFYLYDNAVFRIIDMMEPSPRGELEITDVNKFYLQRGGLSYRMVKGFWSDAGTFESLHSAAKFVAGDKK